MNELDSENRTHNDSEGKRKPSRHARDVFHSWMLEGAEYAGPLDMPVLAGVQAQPNRLVPFSDAMSASWGDFDCWVHFFEDDRNIERFWNNPRAYIGKLRKFGSSVVSVGEIPA